MPELPEVEVVRRALSEIFKNEPIIVKVKWNRPDLRFPLPMSEMKQWKQVRVLNVERRAKYLKIQSERGSLVCHLGMTGNFRLISADEDRRPHDHVEFWFANGQVLVFEDPRRFGFFLKWPGLWSGVTREELGPEPLEDDFNADYFKKVARGKKVPIKTFLMDQRVVVGIGNIYASEILFRAGVRPQRPAQKITKSEAELLVEMTKEVLLAAIRHGGSSIRDYRSPQAGAGSFQDSHLVYGKEKVPCAKCRTLIRRVVLSGRSTYWCRKCQT